ncbi:MAG: hypothetical protein AMXMBFR84_07550 [Candidatus Hydrogenedentota bacterium]
MSQGESISATPVAARAGSPLWPQVKALVWEEIRTGGAIAAALVACCVFLLIQIPFVFGEHAWTLDAAVILGFVTGVPFITSLLLILRTDYSGHLVGGFSGRILRLPVGTSTAVGIVIAVRLTFVALSYAALALTCNLLYGDGPGFASLFSILLMYTIAQTLDWLRAPVSGLVTLLIATLVVLSIAALPNNAGIETIIDAYFALPLGTIGAALVVTVAGSFVVSTAAVHATRAGKRWIGLPEIWQWHELFDSRRRIRTRQFSSPLAAQIWFDMRQSSWMLPCVTFIVWVLLAIGILLAVLNDAKTPLNDDRVYEDYIMVLSLLCFPALLVAGVVHGVTMRALGFRRPSQNIPAHYINPLSSCDLALSRMSANAMILSPVVAVGLILHGIILSWGLLNQGSLLSTIAQSYSEGFTSLREIVWAFAGRGLFAAWFAWPLMAIGTRLIRRLAAFAIVCLVGILVAEILIGDMNDLWELFNLSGGIFLMAVLGWQLWRLRRLSLVPPRTIAVWIAIWALATWLLLSQMRPFVESEAARYTVWLRAGIVCGGLGTLVPLAYAAYVFDYHRRRHGSMVVADSAQHKSPWSRAVGWPTRCTWYAITAFVIWLAWPARPAYVAYLESIPFPATLDEVSRWGDTDNHASAPITPYQDVLIERDRLANAFRHARESQQMSLPPSLRNLAGLDTRGITELIQAGRTSKLTPEMSGAIEDYWQEVTGHITAEIVDTGDRIEGPSQFPASATMAIALFRSTAYYSNLPNELLIDVYKKSNSGDPAGAIASLEANFPLATSLVGFHDFGGQYMRLETYRNACIGLELLMTMNLDDRQLSHLDQIFAQAAAECADDKPLIRAGMGELVVALQFGEDEDGFAYGWQIHSVAWNLLYPLSVERMARLIEIDLRPLDNTARYEDWVAMYRGAKHPPLEWLILNPISRYGFTMFRSTRHATLLHLALARTAIAIRRYSLSHGKLPDSIADLPSDFLRQVTEVTRVEDFDLQTNAKGGFVLSARLPNYTGHHSFAKQDGKDHWIIFVVSEMEMQSSLHATAGT